MNAPRPRWKFTVEQYHAMGRAGILTENDRTELIDGEILAMASKRDEHVACVTNLNRWFSRRLGDDVILSVQDPIILSKDDEPEPDMAIIRLREGMLYSHGKPHAGDVLLVIEVADTTLRYDRSKLARYAAGGIPGVWIFNLRRKVIEVYHEPREASYATSAIIRHGQDIAPLAFPDIALPWSEAYPD